MLARKGGNASFRRYQVMSFFTQAEVGGYLLDRPTQVLGKPRQPKIVPCPWEGSCAPTTHPHTHFMDAVNVKYGSLYGSSRTSLYESLCSSLCNSLSGLAPRFWLLNYRGGENSAGGFFRGENSVFQLGAEFSPHFSRGGAEFSPCGILSM